MIIVTSIGNPLKYLPKQSKPGQPFPTELPKLSSKGPGLRPDHQSRRLGSFVP